MTTSNTPGYPASSRLANEVSRLLVRCGSGVVLLFLASAAMLRGQVAQKTAAPEDETITLSPFEVRASADDNGYITNSALGGTKIGTPLRYTPINIQVVNSKLIEDIGAINAYEALGYQAGVERQAPVGENQTGVNIRGYGIFYQVREGFRRFDMSDAANIDRIEVIAGPAAVFYGFSQPGGLINTFNKAPVENKNFGSFSAMYGTWDQSRFTLDANAAIGHNIAVRVTGSFTNQENSWRDWDYLQRRMISPVIKWRISPSTTLKVDYEYLLNHLQFTHDKIQDADLNQTTGAATLTNRFVPMPRGRQWNGPDQRYNIYVENLIVTLDHKFNNWLSMNMAGNLYGRGTPTGLENNQMRGGPVIAALRDRNQNLVRDTNGNLIKAIRTVWSERDIHNTVQNLRADFLAQFDTVGIKNKILAGWSYTDDKQFKYEIFDRPANATNTNFGSINGQGFNYRYYALDDLHPDLSFNNQNWNAPTFVHPNTNHIEWQKYTAGYVSYAGEMFQGKIHVLAGARYDRFNFQRRALSQVRWSGEGAPVNQSQTKTNPMLGIVYTPVAPLSFYALHSTSLEAPPIQTNSVGDVLANRQGSSLEGGIKFSFLGGRLAGTASVFEIRNKNIAVFDPNIPNLLDPSKMGETVTVGEQTSRGWDLNAGYSVGGYRAVGGVAYVDTFISKDTNPANIGKTYAIFPHYRAALWNYYTFSTGPAKGVSLGLGASWQGEQDRGSGSSWRVNLTDPNSPLVKNDAFTVVGASIRYSTEIGGHDTSFNLTVSNLTNKEDRGGGLWLEPRNIRFTVTTKF